MNKIKISMIFVFIIISVSTVQALEVKGRAISTTFCIDGKCETEPSSDEVIYEIDTEKENIVRKAVLNTAKSLKGSERGGLVSDNTIYSVVSASPCLMMTNGKTVKQFLIKAIGRTGTEDGFEIIVIGEDFIHTSRSSMNYFVIYFYERVN